MKWYAGENLPVTHARPTFSEAWFHSRYGLEFGQRYCLDPLFRTEQDRAARRVLFDRFGHLGIGERDPQPNPHLEICGHRFLPALLGCEIVYQDDQPPASRHLPIESAAETASIQTPDLETNRWAREFRRQAKVLIDHYGRVDATINHGGPINVASNALGMQAYLFLSDESPAYRQFLHRIAVLCLETYDHLTLPFSRGLDPRREMFLGNCPVAMMAPATYRREVLPHDLYLRANVRRFGLHHCGVMDAYLEDYKGLEPLEYVEVGWGSDLAAVRRVFPTTVLDLMINVPDVGGMSSSELGRRVAGMVRQAKPLCHIRDIWVADIGPDVPDEVVVTFVEAVNAAFTGA